MAYFFGQKRKATRETLTPRGMLAHARLSLRLTSVVLALLAGLVTIDTGALAQSAAADSHRPWTGDLDGMWERGVIRILVPLSPTLFYQSKGESFGAEAELGSELEKLLNERHGNASRKIKVVYVPTARKRLLEDLRRGRGDIAAGNLTIIPDRTEIVDFAQPWATGIKEVLVTGPAAPKIESMADLADHEIKVKKLSSYYVHLLSANEKLIKSGKRPIKVALEDDNLEDEHILEQVNAGLLPWAIVDSHIAKLWTKILPDLTVREDISFNEDGEIGWALRKNSPKLKAELDQFVKTLRSSGFSK